VDISKMKGSVAPTSKNYSGLIGKVMPTNMSNYEYKEPIKFEDMVEDANAQAMRQNLEMGFQKTNFK
jgi:putative aminopeptidase FrvX